MRGMEGDAGRWDRRDALALVGLLLVALALRWPGWGDGFTTDEVANVVDGTASQIFWDAETPVNPPLLRMLNLGFADALVPVAGRWLSLLASMAAIVGTYGLARQRSRGMALLAAGLLVVHPLAIRYALLFRAYAPWTGLCALHLWSMPRWEDGRRWQVAAVVTAVLLPWTHYLSVPVMVAFGAVVLSWRGWRPFGVYVMAAVLFSPVALYAVRSTGLREPPVTSVEQTVQTMVGLDLLPPRQLEPAARWIWELVSADAFHFPAWMALSTLALLGVSLLRWRSLTRGEQLALGGAMGLIVAIMAAGGHVRIREPVALMVVVLVTPVLAAGLAWPGGPWRWLAVACALGWYGPEMPERHAHLRARAQLDSGPQVAADAWERMEDPLYVTPTWMLPALRFHVTGEVSRSWDDAPCGDRSCFVHDGIRVFGYADDVGMILRFPEAGQDLPSRCELAWSSPPIEAWRCAARRAGP